MLSKTEYSPHIDVIVFQFILLEISEWFLFVKRHQDFFNVTVIYRIRLRLMVAAELGRKRIKAVILSVHLHIRNVIYQRVIAISEPCIDVQTINMLSQSVNIKDIDLIV